MQKRNKDFEDLERTTESNNEEEGRYHHIHGMRFRNEYSYECLNEVKDFDLLGSERGGRYCFHEYQ